MLFMQKCSGPLKHLFSIVGIIFIFILLSNKPHPSNLILMREQADSTQKNQPKIQQGWTLSPIQIDDMATGAGAHNWSWAVSQDWCRGSGTLVDPYIIENITIDAANGAYGISISNSIKNFIIRNCSISNAGSSTWYAGMYMYNVSNGIITENSLVDNEKAIILRQYCENNTLSWNNITGKTLSGSDYGIYLYYYGQNNTIYQNRIDYVGYGVSIAGTSLHNNISLNWFDTISYYPIYISSASHYTVIAQNQIQTGDHHGIYVDNSQYCNLTSNQISSIQEHGIYLANGADYTNLTGNVLTNINNLGIRIDNSMNCFLADNSMTKSGVGSGIGIRVTSNSIADYFHQISPSNTLDGKPIYYYRDQTNLNSINFTNAAQIYLVNCSYSTVVNFSFSNTAYGLLLANCSYISVNNNSFTSHYFDGLFLYNVKNSNLTENEIFSNHRNGLNIIYYSNQIFAENNTITYNVENGAYISSYCDDLTLYNNNLSRNTLDGLYITDNCLRINASYNNISYNEQDGLELGSYSDYFSCSYNQIHHNLYNGLYLRYYTDYADIFHNDIFDNSRYGLYVNNRVQYSNFSHNYLLRNGLSGNYYGMYMVSDSNFNRITYNIFRDNQKYGLYLYYCEQITIENNQFNSSGFAIYGTYDVEFEHYVNTNNSYDGGWIYYYLNGKNLRTTDFTNAKQIYLINCDGASINDITITNQQYGLFLWNSSHISVNTANLTYSYEKSIYMRRSSNNSIINADCRWYGINYALHMDQDCSDNYFSNCKFSQTPTAYGYGAYLTTNCVRNTFYNNTFANNGDRSIFITNNCNWNNFTHNLIENTRRYDGIYVGSTSNYNLFKDNTIRNNPRSGIYITGSSFNQILDNNISDNGLSGYHGIYIYNNALNTTISGNTVIDNYGHGVYINTGCHGTKIIGNNVSLNGGSSSYGYGIEIVNNCDNFTVQNNNAQNNRKSGIFISNNCQNGLITRNNASFNQENGIFLQDNCNYLSILDNNMNFNTLHGFSMLDYCDNILIENNRMINNSDHGMYFENFCDANTVFNNTVSNNSAVGIGFYSLTNDNLIYFNNFTNNGLHAIDNGLVNDWDNSSHGNYWNNYTGRDLDDDLIGDIEWVIIGSANAIDHFPLWDDGLDLQPLPDLSTPSDVEYFFGELGHNITWVANTTFPDSYIITRNGSVIISGAWFNFIPISINVDFLSVGIYEYNCTVNTTRGDWISDLVIVTVKRTQPLITHPLDQSFIVGDNSRNITWLGDAPFPDTVAIIQNGIQIYQNSWISQESIVIDLVDLFPGNYTYECWLNATSGEFVSDIVHIMVIEPTMNISHPEDLVLMYNTSFVPGSINITWVGQSVIPDSVVIYENNFLVYQSTWQSDVPIIFSVQNFSLGFHIFECVINSSSGKIKSDLVYLTIIEPDLEISHPEDIIITYNESLSSGDVNITWIGSSPVPSQAVVYENEVKIYQNNWSDGIPFVFSITNFSLGTHIFECFLNSTSGKVVSDVVSFTVLEPEPILSHLDDLQYNASDGNQSLTWIGYSPFADSVIIYQNGEIVYQGDWENGVPINFSLNGLEPGQYVFQCVLTTNTGETITDTVVVIIDDPTAGPSESELLLNQIEEMKDDYQKKQRNLWIVIIVLGVMLAASLGALSYYRRKQKDYETYQDILRKTSDSKFEEGVQEQYLTSADMTAEKPPEKPLRMRRFKKPFIRLRSFTFKAKNAFINPFRKNKLAKSDENITKTDEMRKNDKKKAEEKPAKDKTQRKRDSDKFGDSSDKGDTKNIKKEDESSKIPQDFSDLLEAKTEIISHRDEFTKIEEKPNVPKSQQNEQKKLMEKPEVEISSSSKNQKSVNMKKSLKKKKRD